MVSELRRESPRGLLAQCVCHTCGMDHEKADEVTRRRERWTDRFEFLQSIIFAMQVQRRGSNSRAAASTRLSASHARDFDSHRCSS